MAFALFDRVRETSVTTGTSDMLLAGAVGNYRAFSAVYANADTMFYFIVMGAAFESGIGTYNSGANSITRTTVIQSSNSNNAVNFGAGTKDIWVGLPGSYAAPLRRMTYASNALSVDANILKLTGTRTAIVGRGDSGSHVGGIQLLSSATDGSIIIITPVDSTGTVANGKIQFGGFGSFNSQTVDVALSGRLGVGTNTPDSDVTIQSDSPTVQFYDSGGGSDEKFTYFFAGSSGVVIYAANDAKNASSQLIAADRSGNGWTALRVPVADFQVTNALSKGSGTFHIDHPLDPLNRDLVHGFVEAPRYDLIYRGRVTLVDGHAVVDIDAASRMTAGTFAALTQNAEVVTLENRSGFGKVRATEVVAGQFTIIHEDADSTDEIAWVVIAERADPFIRNNVGAHTDADGRMVPELDKPE